MLGHGEGCENKWTGPMATNLGSGSEVRMLKEKTFT